jgi:HEAT repeat protein
VLPAAKAFCLSEEPLLGGRQPNIAWALRIIEDVADATQEWDLLQALLAKHPPEYSRYPTLKTQLLVHVAEIDDPRTVDILLGYLDDPDENVRFLAIESLLEIRDPRARPAFVARVCNPQEDSVRLRTRILDGLADLGWDVSDSIEVLSKNLGREHLLQAGKVVRR